MQSLLDAAAAYLDALSPAELVWIAVGFAGQFLFMMRFLWQWIQSELKRRSVIPIAFWYFSLAGGMNTGRCAWIPGSRLRRAPE